MRSLLATLIGLSLGAALAAPALAQDIDTRPDGTTFGISRGWDHWGQTFRASAAERYLDSFGFYIQTDAALTFSASIHRWTGSALGESLWSGTRTMNALDRGWQYFDTGSLLLDPAQVYAAFLVPTGADAGAYSGVGYASTPYVEGNLVLREDYSTSISQFSSLDAAFRADFSATRATTTPEPVSMALLGTGLAGLGVARRRRRARDGAAS